MTFLSKQRFVDLASLLLKDATNAFVRAEETASRYPDAHSRPLTLCSLAQKMCNISLSLSLSLSVFL